MKWGLLPQIDDDIAGDALKLIKVEYEVLPFIVYIDARLTSGGPKLRPGRKSFRRSSAVL